MWKTEFEKMLPYMGHRNWILIVDKAFPLQTAAGMTFLDSESSMEEVVEYVWQQIAAAPHLRPVVYLDRESRYLDDTLCPGAEALFTASSCAGCPGSDTAHAEAMGTQARAETSDAITIMWRGRYDMGPPRCSFIGVPYPEDGRQRYLDSSVGGMSPRRRTIRGAEKHDAGNRPTCRVYDGCQRQAIRLRCALAARLAPFAGWRWALSSR